MENLPLEEKRRQKISRHLAAIPKVYRSIYEKSVTGKSKSTAIKAFCLECCMWQKNEITECTALTCPLYAVRPYAGHRKTPKDKGFSPLRATNTAQPVQSRG